MLTEIQALVCHSNFGIPRRQTTGTDFNRVNLLMAVLEKRLGMQIGGHCPHVTHGQSLAVFYPAFTRYTYPAAEHKFATVGRIFEPSLERESDAVAAERSCDAIDCFLKRIGLWINFRELNVTKEDIREIADCGQVLGDYANNPRVATIPEMYELLMSCYDRK